MSDERWLHGMDGWTIFTPEGRGEVTGSEPAPNPSNWYVWVVLDGDPEGRPRRYYWHDVVPA